eukprot:6789889-Lingulodinium_polyedra.AAC.1
MRAAAQVEERRDVLAEVLVPDRRRPARKPLKCQPACQRCERRDILPLCRGPHAVAGQRRELGCDQLDAGWCSADASLEAAA